MEANLDMATTCLSYLCLDIFDPDMEDEDMEEEDSEGSDLEDKDTGNGEMQKKILSGQYCLHWFAISQWIEAVRRCAGMLRNGSPPDELIGALERFISKRENISNGNPGEKGLKCEELEGFKHRWPGLYDMLRRAVRFSRLDTGSWRLDEGNQSKLSSSRLLLNFQRCWRVGWC